MQLLCLIGTNLTRARLLLAGIVGLALLPAFSAPAGAVSYTLFSSGITGEPTDITAGPDGNLWFAEKTASSLSGKIGRITPSGTVTEFTFSNGATNQPVDITATMGAGGAIWFAEPGSGGANGWIGKVTTGGSVTKYDVPAGDPSGITVGPDGFIWFTQPAAKKVGKLNPANGAITEYSTGDSTRDITAGPDGNIWLRSSLNWVGKMVPNSGTLTKYTLPNSKFLYPDGAIVAGSDGKIWFTGVSENHVGVTTTTGVTTLLAATSNKSYGIESGPDGGVWFTRNLPSSSGLIRINPATGETVNFDPPGSIYPGAQSPPDVTKGPAGDTTNLWMAAKNGILKANILDQKPWAVTTSGGYASFLTPANYLLTGSVHGQGFPTTYYFEYGPTSNYGSKTETKSLSGTGVAAATTVIAVIPPLALPASKDPYHFRLVVSNAAGTTYGEDKTFSTVDLLERPLVSVDQVESITETSAVLKGKVNPRDKETSYYFEYGPTTDYGQVTPTASGLKGSTDQPVAAGISGLTPGTVYHFRLVATNSDGIRRSSDLTFSTTAPAPKPVVAQAVKCVVPKLIGKTLGAAKKRLKSAVAKCKFKKQVVVKASKLKKYKRVKRGLVVVRQKPKAGSKLTSKTVVKLTLGKKKRSDK